MPLKVNWPYSKGRIIPSGILPQDAEGRAKALLYSGVAGKPPEDAYSNLSETSQVSVPPSSPEGKDLPEAGEKVYSLRQVRTMLSLERDVARSVLAALSQRLGVSFVDPNTGNYSIPESVVRLLQIGKSLYQSHPGKYVSYTHAVLSYLDESQQGGRSSAGDEERETFFRVLEGISVLAQRLSETEAALQSVSQMLTKLSEDLSSIASELRSLVDQAEGREGVRVPRQV